MRPVMPVLIALALLYVGPRCSSGDKIAGGTTETGNSRVAVIRGTVTDSLGQAVGLARVLALPGNHNPFVDSMEGDSVTVTTTPAGTFELEVPSFDSYTLSIWDRLSGRGALRFGIDVWRSDSGQVLSIGTVRLRAARRLPVVIDTSVAVANGVVFIPGTHHRASPDSSRFALLDSVWSSRVPLAYYDLDRQRTVVDICDVPVNGTDTCFVRRSGSSVGSFVIVGW